MGSKGLKQFIWKVRLFKIFISNGLQQSQTLLELKTPPPKDSYGLRLCYGKFLYIIPPTSMDSTISMLPVYWVSSTMDSNGLKRYDRKINEFYISTPLDSNRICHQSNYYFYLSTDFYYRTPTKMDYKGLQQFIWKVHLFKISISNGLQQSQTLIE